MKLTNASKEIINEFKNVCEFDGLSSLESEESELYDEENNDTDEQSNSSISDASIQPYYKDEETTSEKHDDEDKLDEDNEAEKAEMFNENVYSNEDNPRGSSYISSQTNESISCSAIESDDDHSDPDYSPTQTNITYLLRKIFKKLAQLTQITTEFNRFKTELNTKLDGNHTEYEILVEDLIESVVREGSKQSMLVKSLKDELIKSKCEAAEDVVFESENIESKKILLDYDRIGSEVEELNIKLHESPPSKVKLTQTSFIMSVILGVTLGLVTAYYIKYYLKLY